MPELNFKTNMKLAHKTAEAIDAAIVKNAEDGFREHLGASLIGGSCNRKLWYSFRWSVNKKHPAQLLRIFQRGHDEEARLTKLLRQAGMQVMSVNPATGLQFNFKDGHFGGSMDGAVLNVPDAPKTWHVLEYKTSARKAFETLIAKGVKDAKPEHYAQMQIYMLKMELTRALYVTVCKDDDRLHLERIDFDEVFAQSMVDKAQWIIASPTPPEGISTDPTWYECGWCDYKDICHKQALPLPTCRTCLHVTPERDGVWNCAHNKCTLTAQDQKESCTEHRYIPILLKNFADPTDANDTENWVQYRMKDGIEFNNGPDGFSSQELHALEDKSMLGFDQLLELRKQFDGRIVG